MVKRGRKSLRKSVTESYLTRKVKVEKDREPTRFSRRIRNMAPSLTSYSEILRNPVKFIKTEKHIGEYEKSVLNQDSSAQFLHPGRVKRRTIRYPIEIPNSKQVFNILSAPKVHTESRRKRWTRSKHYYGITVSKEQQPFVNQGGNKLAQIRKKYVLEIINYGDQKDIEKLHSVGCKTAERILLFRQLKGAIGKISELTLMPKFTKSRYNNFLQQNFLKT